MFGDFEKAIEALAGLHEVTAETLQMECLLRIAMRRQHVTGSAEAAEKPTNFLPIDDRVMDDVFPARESSRSDDAATMLRNLLARIHRDGGHHTQEVGLALSVKDADERVASLYSEHDDHLARVLSKREPTDESWGLMVRHKLGKARGMLEALLEEKEEGRAGEFTAEQIREVLNETADPDRRYDAVADALSWLWSAYPQSRDDVRRQMRRAMLALGRGPNEDDPEPAGDARYDAIHDLTETLASTRRVLTEEASKYQREADSWKETAAQAQRNTDYYLGLVDQIAVLFGDAAYVSDDGSKQDSPVRAKVPSLVKEAFEELRAEAKRAWTHVEEIAKVLDCGASQVQILMTLTKTMADATRETEQARNGRDEAIRQRDALRIERDTLAADNSALKHEIESLRKLRGGA